MGQNTLDLLVLQNEMQRYPLKVEGIPEYINIIKDAQNQAGRAGQTISNENYSSSQRQQYLPPRYFRAPTMIGKFARNLPRRGTT